MARFNTWKIWEIKELIANKRLVVPSLQREMVWKSKDVSLLQESIMDKFPIGTLIVSQQDEKFYLLDGLQRVTSIIKIIGDKYKSITKNSLKKIYNETTKKHPNISKKMSFDSFQKFINVNSKKIMSKDAGEIAHFINDNFLFKYLKKQEENKWYEFTREFVDKLLAQLPSEEYEIPYIAYDGEIKHLARIFELLNKQGTALTELEILAAKWNDIKIPLNSTEFQVQFLKDVNDRYAKLEDLGLQKEADKNANEVSPIELLYGITKRVAEKTEWMQFKDIFLENNSSKIKNMNIMMLIIKALLGEGETKNEEVGKLLFEKFSNKTDDLERFIQDMLDTANKINSVMTMFSFKSNGKKHSSTLQFGDSYLAWLLVTFMNEEENITEKRIQEIEVSFFYKIIDEEFGSGSADKAYKALINKTEHNLAGLLSLIKSKNDQIINDSRLVNFPKWIKIITSFIYIKRNNQETFDFWRSNSFEYDHLVPKAKLTKGKPSLGNFSILPHKDNREKSDNIGEKYLKEDFIYKVYKNQLEDENDIMLEKYLKAESEDEYVLFIEERHKVIFEILKNIFNKI